MMEQLLLDQILMNGADHVRLHFRKIEKHTLSLSGGEFTSLATEETSSVRVMAVRGGRVADKTYDLGSGDEVSRILPDILLTLETAPEQDESPSFGSGKAQFRDICSSFDADTMKSVLRSLEENASEAGAELTSATVIYERREDWSLSSSHENIYSLADGYTCSYHAVITKDGRTVDPFAGHFSFRRPEDTPGLSPLLAGNAPLLFDAEPVPVPFTGDLIVAPSCGYYLLMDFLFGQLFEDSLLSGSGVWQKRFGTKVVSERFTASLDPFEPSVVFGERINISGNVSAGYDIIRDGILKNGILSPHAAAALGLAPSANDGDNLVVSPGTRSVAEMLADVADGVLLFSFAGECSSDGSFSGVGNTAFRVRNGQIVSAIDSCRISGNWFDILSCDRFEFSLERECNGESVVPWINIGNIQFS